MSSPRKLPSEVKGCSLSCKETVMPRLCELGVSLRQHPGEEREMSHHRFHRHTRLHLYYALAEQSSPGHRRPNSHI